TGIAPSKDLAWINLFPGGFCIRSVFVESVKVLMRSFHPGSEDYFSGAIAFSDCSEPANIVRIGPSRTATFDLDEHDFEKITSLESAAKGPMIFANCK